MYDFFREIALEGEEKLSEKRVDSIKAAVLSRIKEENSMKKISAFKTFSIAATVAATAAMSAMLASAEKPVSLPTEQPAAEQPAAEETPKTADEKASDKENAANSEDKSGINELVFKGAWLRVELPNGKAKDVFVPEGKKIVTFDNEKSAFDYAISHSTAEDDYILTFDDCYSYAIYLEQT